MIVECRACGAEFETHRADAVLCSARCAARNANRARWKDHEPDSKPCELCGAAFTRNPHYSRAQWAGARFCSGKCRSKVTAAVKRKPIPLCGCGCGEPVKRRGRTFLRGHFTPIMPNGRPPKKRPYEYFDTNKQRWYVALEDGTRIARYRLVMARHLGRKLTRREVVHHVNGDSTDDRIENLELCGSQSEHIHLHHGRALT